MKRRRIVIVTALALGVMLWGNAAGFLPVGKFAYEVVRPLGTVLSGIGQRGASGLVNLRGGGELTAENQALRAEIARLKYENTQFGALARENEELRNQLEFNDKHSLNTLGANIIGYEPDSAYRLVRLDRGSRDGVTPGSSVLWNGYLVGKVSDVGVSFSNVLLVNDLRFRALVVGADSGTTGIVKGGLGGGLTMERIPPADEILPGELIVASGLDGEFLKGLPLGEVISVEHPEGSVFKTAQIRIFFEPIELTNLFIVMGD